MHTVCFEIEGRWGLFRKPYASASPVSYPVPPPTAVLGLVGAICGYGKDEYHERIGWEGFRVGLRLLQPVRSYRAAINLLNTKDGVEKLVGCPKGESYRIQIPHEVLADPAFRVWVTGLDKEAASALVVRLSGDGPVYTPVLGLASCLADVRFVGEGDAEPLGPSSATEPLDCVVPLEEGVEVEYDPTRPYQRLRVPGSMQPDRTVTRYPEIVVADDAGPIHVSGAQRYRLEDDVFCLL